MSFLVCVIYKGYKNTTTERKITPEKHIALLQ
jgi:hypothetical protein